jgi:hypothetical protein
VVRVNALGPVDEVTARIVDALAQRNISAV